MQICQPLSFYFPGLVLFVDDNAALLKALEGELSPLLNMQTETNPIRALKIIEQKSKPCYSNLIESVNDSDFDLEMDCLVNVHISKIFKKMDVQKRFSELTVLVVDQSMPEMSGIELCEKLQGYRFKKIMLTAEKDNQLAIEAFNKGLIDYFIAKENNQQKLINHLQSAINYLQQKYFVEQSALILDAATVLPGSFLKEQQFIALFNKFLTDYQICEFYLLDTTGSFVGLNANGYPYWFLVKNEKQMLNFLDVAKSSEAEPSIIQKLEERTALIYCLTSEELDIGIDQWSSLLHSVSYKEKKFYIAVVEGNLRGFKHNQISSFENYREIIFDAK